jgi:hypothetical protein
LLPSAQASLLTCDGCGPSIPDVWTALGSQLIVDDVATSMSKGSVESAGDAMMIAAGDIATATSTCSTGPADTTQSIEFRDYLVESGVLTADIDLLYTEPEWAVEYDAAWVKVEQLGGVGAHIIAVLPPDWRQYLDLTGAEAFIPETRPTGLHNATARTMVNSLLGTSTSRLPGTPFFSLLGTPTRRLLRTPHKSLLGTPTSQLLGTSARTKPAWSVITQWSCKKDPAEVHDLCRRCSAAIRDGFLSGRLDRWSADAMVGSIPNFWCSGRSAHIYSAPGNPSLVWCMHAQRHLAAYRTKSRQIEVNVSEVLLMDPARLGHTLVD